MWWDRPIDPGRGYGPPLTWGGLLAPLLLVAGVLLWKVTAAVLAAGLVGVAVYAVVHGNLERYRRERAFRERAAGIPWRPSPAASEPGRG